MPIPLSPQQAVHDVISGKYCCSIETASFLAAFMVLEKFGAHNPASHKPGFLTNRLFEYIPGNKFALKKPAQWEEDIFVQHKALGETTPQDAKVAYLKVVSEAAYYGCEFFDVQLSNDVRNSVSVAYPASFIVGINGVGIVCLKPRDGVGQGLNPIERHPLSFIGRWGFKPGENFYFEMKEEGKQDRIFHLKTTQGQIVSNLLTDYAMALLKELDEEEQEMEGGEGGDGGDGGGKEPDEPAAPAADAKPPAAAAAAPAAAAKKEPEAAAPAAVPAAEAEKKEDAPAATVLAGTQSDDPDVLFWTS